MDDYPGNSRSSRVSSKETAPAKGKPEIKKVVEGSVKRRKKTLGQRIFGVFSGSDARSVWNYVVLEVLIPAGKDMVTDAVTQGVERAVFGEARGSSRRRGNRSSGNSGFVSYNRMSGGSSIRRGRDENPAPSSRNRRKHAYDEIVLDSRAEANEVLDQMFTILSQYEQVSVANLYDLVGESGNFTDERWGWETLEGSRVHRTRDGGYLLDLPDPEPLS